MKCPLCNVPIDKSKVSQDLLATNLIGEFNIYCPHKQIGCEWKGQLNDAAGHEKNDCRFAQGTEL